MLTFWSFISSNADKGKNIIVKFSFSRESISINVDTSQAQSEIIYSVLLRNCPTSELPVAEFRKAYPVAHYHFTALYSLGFLKEGRKLITSGWWKLEIGTGILGFPTRNSRVVVWLPSRLSKIRQEIKCDKPWAVFLLHCVFFSNVLSTRKVLVLALDCSVPWYRYVILLRTAIIIHSFIIHLI